MSKKIVGILVVLLLLLAPLSYVHAVEVFNASTELRQWDKSKAYNGYTVFTPFKFGPNAPWTTWMIDMEGNVVHSFQSQYGPGLHAYLLEDGTWLRGAQMPEANTVDTYNVLSGPRVGGLEVLDWKGNVLWHFDHYSVDEISHHDFHKIWNKKLNQYTYIQLVFQRKNVADAELLGTDPIYVNDYTGNPPTVDGWSLDGIIEVNQNKEIIWSWSFADHLVTTDPGGTASAVEFTDATGRPNSPPLVVADMAGIAATPQKLDVNWETVYGGPNSDWTHCNSLDYNEELDYIVVNAKHMSEFYVIDHDATFVSTTDWDANKAAARSDLGDFVYRFGNPNAYNQGAPAGYHTEGDYQMYASHDIQWINDYHWEPDYSGQGLWPDPTAEVALPGAGNFIIFDNGAWRTVDTCSSVPEINPYIMDDLGTLDTAYFNPPDAGYQPGATSHNSNQVVWRYKSKVNTSFYSFYISGAQRLPNGNTMICSGATGHFFEVTPAGEVVWEYINPETFTGFNETIDDNDATMLFSVFRAHRYGPNFPGLKGKKLTPIGTITGRVPLSGTGAFAQYPEEPVYTGWGFTGTGIGGGGGVGGGGGGGGAGGY